MRGGLNLFLYTFSVCHIFWGLVLGLVVVIFNGFCFVLGATNWIAQRKKKGKGKDAGEQRKVGVGGYGIGPGNMMWRLCRFRCSCGTSAIIASVIRSACQSNRRSSSSRGRGRGSGRRGAQRGRKTLRVTRLLLIYNIRATSAAVYRQKEKGQRRPMQTARRKARHTPPNGADGPGPFSEGRCRSLGVFSVFHSQLFPTSYQLPVASYQLPTRQRKSQKRY